MATKKAVEKQKLTTFTWEGTDKNGKTVKGVSPLAMDMLLKHSWPGNVRELENTMERAVIAGFNNLFMRSRGNDRYTR